MSLKNIPRRFDPDIVEAVAVSIEPAAFFVYTRPSKKRIANQKERQRMAKVAARRAIRTYENSMYQKMLREGR